MGRVWKFITFARSVDDRLVIAELRAWNAALSGVKMVRFEVVRSLSSTSAA